MISKLIRNRRLEGSLALSVALLVACQAAPSPSGDEGGTFYPPTNRPDIRGTKGAVSAGHPLAAQVGLGVLQDGGNAVDAAVAMAAVLAVVRPHMNGVGGDAFVFVYEGASAAVHALNGSGRSGALATPAFFMDQGPRPDFANRFDSIRHAEATTPGSTRPQNRYSGSPRRAVEGSCGVPTCR